MNRLQNVLVGISLVLVVSEVVYPGQLLNLSTRGYVDAVSKKLYAGIVIAGESPKEVIIKVRGASLPVADALSDPKLTVFDSERQEITSNDNWQMGASAARVDSSGFAPTNDAEPAVALTLQPGLYTAVVESSDGSEGDAVVSVNDLTVAEENPFELDDYSGSWRILVIPSISEVGGITCPEAEGYFNLDSNSWNESYYNVTSGFLSVVADAAQQQSLFGAVDNGIATIYAMRVEGASSAGAVLGDKTIDMNGLFSESSARGQWSDVDGCYGSWSAYKG